MPQQSDEQRRSEVNRLLNECIDQKLLRGGTDGAIAKASTAYAMAWEEPPVRGPWPHLAAYRLAHLKMRSPELDVSSLQEIDDLLSKASLEGALGPLPSIYRLAILSRLSSALQDRVEKDCVTQKVIHVLHAAVKAIRVENLLQTPKEPVALQTTAFNLLELACYFLGAPQPDLEGLCGLNDLDPLRKGDWYIVGRDVEKIPMTEKLARCEFEARASTGKYVLIEFFEGSMKWGVSTRGIRKMRKAYPKSAKLVLLSLETPPMASKDLRRRVVGSGVDEPEVAFRQIKSRAKRALQTLLKRPKLNVFAGDSLAPEVPILGLVHGPTLRSRKSPN